MNDSADAKVEITRRDFVGATLLGAGVALLDMPAPALAQTVSAPLDDLTKAWTGPGGIGDYAASPGNTHEVINAAHGAIRDMRVAGAMGRAIDTGETPDLIVIGGGISGLSAAWNYRIARPEGKVLILDDHPIFGGHAKQNEFIVDGVHLTAPQGATGFVLPIVSADASGLGSPYVERLGFPKDFKFQEPTGLSQPIRIPEDPWTPMHVGWARSDTGFYYGDGKWAKNPWNNGFREAPISQAAKDALMALELYRIPPMRPDWEHWLDGMTYLDFLKNEVGIDEKALPEVLDYVSSITCAMGCGLGPEAISAYVAFKLVQPGVVAYWRALNNGTDPTDGTYLGCWPGGHTGTAKHFLKKIIPDAIAGEYKTADIIGGKLNWDAIDRKDADVRMRLKALVVNVTHDGPVGTASHVIVTYRKGGKLYKVRAKAVILCTPQQVNKRICTDLSADFKAAMGQFNHAPMMVVNVAVRHWRYMDKLGIASARWFKGFGWWLSLKRHLEIDGLPTEPLDPNKPTVLTFYNPMPAPGLPYAEQCVAARMNVFSMPFSEIEKAVREQMTEMFGTHGFNADRDIAGIIANRWGHAYSVNPPGRFFGKDGTPSPYPLLQKRYGRLAFGHSELAGIQGWHYAAEQGERATKEILHVA